MFVHVKWHLKQVAHSLGKGVVMAVDYMEGLHECEKQRNGEWKDGHNQSAEVICGNFKVGGNLVTNVDQCFCKVKVSQPT